jgi:hypothetical protein
MPDKEFRELFSNLFSENVQKELFKELSKETGWPKDAKKAFLSVVDLQHPDRLAGLLNCFHYAMNHINDLLLIT